MGLPGLRAERERQLFTQNALAAATGLHRTTICELEVGRRNGHFDTVRQLAETLGVKPQILLDAPPTTRRRGKRPPGRPRTLSPAVAGFGPDRDSVVGPMRRTPYGTEAQTGT